MFGLEPVVEPLGDLVDVEGGLDLVAGVDQGQGFLFLQGHFQGPELLDQRVARLGAVAGVFAAGGGAAGLAFHPLPHLGGLLGVGKYDQVFVDRFGYPLLDFPAQGIRRNGFALGRRALVRDHAALFGHGRERNHAPVDGHFQRGLVVVPAEFLGEQAGEVGLGEVPSDASESERHGAATPVGLR